MNNIMRIKIIISIVCLILNNPFIHTQTLPSGHNQSMGRASVKVSKDTLIVCTGKMERKWVLTKTGNIQQITVSPEGMVELRIDNPADFSFLQYQTVK